MIPSIAPTSQPQHFNTTLMAESKKASKSLLMKVKEASEKADLKLNVQKKIKIMASGPITSWQIYRVTMETVTDFIFLGSSVTVDGDCNHEIRRGLLLGRKAITNLNSVLKSRDIILLTKVHIVKDMVFQVVMYGCESWTIKNWCFWTVVLEKNLESSGLQGNQTSQPQRKSTLNMQWKDWCWSWSSNILAT